jgi:hypothetical protein
MGYRVLIPLILAAHYAYLAYLVAGGFLAWRWPRTWWLHVVAAAWGVAVVGLRLDCPLTYAEDWARRRAGQPPVTRGFIDRYVEGVLFPRQYADAVLAMVALVILISWIGFTVREARRRPRPARSRSRSRTR